MAVVVNDELIAEALGLKARTGGAEGSRADGDLEETIGVGADERKRRDSVVDGKLWRHGGGDVFRGAAGEQACGSGGGGAVDEVASSHLARLWISA